MHVLFSSCLGKHPDIRGAFRDHPWPMSPGRPPQGEVCWRTRPERRQRGRQRTFAQEEVQKSPQVLLPLRATSSLAQRNLNLGQGQRSQSSHLAQQDPWDSRRLGPPVDQSMNKPSHRMPYSYTQTRLFLCKNLCYAFTTHTNTDH